MNKLFKLKLVFALFFATYGQAKYQPREKEEKTPFDYLKLYTNAKITLNTELTEFNDALDMFYFAATNYTEGDELTNYLTDGKIPNKHNLDNNQLLELNKYYQYVKAMPSLMISFLLKNFGAKDKEKIDELQAKIPRDENWYRRGDAFDPEVSEVGKIVIPAMTTWVKKLDSWLNDGDILIVPGNTGQYVTEAFKAYSAKKVAVVPIAISGAPGVSRLAEGSSFEWARNILTPTGQKNYQSYIKDLLKDKLKKLGDNNIIYIIDIVSGGYGISFLIKCLEELGFGNDTADTRVINIDKTYTSNDNKTMAIHRLQIDYQDLSNVKQLENYKITDRQLASKFDTIAAKYRLMPDFPAYMWDNWKANDPSKFEPATEALKFKNDIVDYFSNLKKE